MLQAALFWARDNDVPSFLYTQLLMASPLAPKGLSARGRANTRLTRNGLKDATTNERQVRLFWRQHPHANIGGRMGGELRLFAVDSDPRHGGDLSLHDLTEAHGPQWLNRLNNGAGGNGDRFSLSLPRRRGGCAIQPAS